MLFFSVATEAKKQIWPKTSRMNENGKPIRVVKQISKNSENIFNALPLPDSFFNAGARIHGADDEHRPQIRHAAQESEQLLL